jgi:hypothetical protein
MKPYNSGVSLSPSKLRICRYCGASSATTAFHFNSNSCVPCRRQYMHEWRKKNPHKIREHKRPDPACPIYKLRKKNSWIKSKYGITLADRERMREEQQGKCLICKKAPIGKWWHGLVIDHCHATGKVRGLLCNFCNSRLGWFEQFHNEIKEYLKG